METSVPVSFIYRCIGCRRLSFRLESEKMVISKERRGLYIPARHSRLQHQYLLIIWCVVFVGRLAFQINRHQTAVRPGSVAFCFVGLWGQTLADHAKCASTTSTTSLHPALTPQCRPAQPPPGACKVGFAVYTVITEASAVQEKVSGWMDGFMNE